MAAQVLPDREQRHLLQFYVAARMGYRTRLAVAGGSIGTGLAIQLLWTSATLPLLLGVSLPLLLAGNLLLLVRGYNLKPSHRLVGGKWEKTTRDRFREACQLEDRVKRWDQTFADLTCVPGVLCLILLAAAAMLIGLFLESQASTRFWAPIFVADAAVLFLPHWITGTRRGWRPTELIQQIRSLETALKAIETFEDPPCQIQPMFQLAGKKHQLTPVAARVFVRFPDGPEDFLGIQYQVSLNDVQGTKYPYLYAVIVARKTFGLLENHLADVKRGGRSLTVEPSSESDVEVIVIRQATTKTSGYHTDASAVRRIARLAWQSGARILAAAAPQESAPG